MGRFLLHTFFWYYVSRASMALSQHGDPSDHCFLDFRVLLQGGYCESEAKLSKAAQGNLANGLQQHLFLFLSKWGLEHRGSILRGVPVVHMQCACSARTVRVLGLSHRPMHLFYGAVHVFPRCTRYDHCMYCTVPDYGINRILFMASLRASLSPTPDQMVIGFLPLSSPRPSVGST